MSKDQKTYHKIVVKTNPGISWIMGRNGLTDIGEIEVNIHDDHVTIDGISAIRQVCVNGGFSINRKAFDDLLDRLLEWKKPEVKITCDNCRKCGETVCGNDTENMSCFEPKQ
jgi:hypothetical protein